MIALSRMTRLLCGTGVVPCLAACAGGEVGGTIDADGTSIDSVRVDCVFSAGLRGTVTGMLPGTALTLVNDGNQLAIAADGPFAVGQTLADGTAYGVSVLVQPAGAFCVVQNGSGSFFAASFQDIVVTCS